MSFVPAGVPGVPARSNPVAVSHALAGTIAVGAVLLALLTLYAVYFDQGALLSPVLGRMAVTANYLHEFAHDGRHLLGAPCH